MIFRKDIKEIFADQAADGTENTAQDKANHQANQHFRAAGNIIKTIADNSTNYSSDDHTGKEADANPPIMGGTAGRFFGIAVG